jgi:hypothetical protein
LKKRVKKLLRVLGSVLAIGAAPGIARAGSYGVLHQFTGGVDGAAPVAPVIIGPTGVLYGSASAGASQACDSPQDIHGCGTIFSLTPPAPASSAWTFDVLYRFTDPNDGYAPEAALLLDTAGNLYGTTLSGGANAAQSACGITGCGTVFRLSPPATPGGAWTKITLYSFLGARDGGLPAGRLIFDGGGALIGTAMDGGIAPADKGYGVVFRLAPPTQPGGPWTERPLHRFTGGSGGATPRSALLAGPGGTYFTTTFLGGTDLFDCNGGCGAVLQLTPPASGQTSWGANLIHGFSGPVDGGNPAGDLAADPAGNLYGATSFGGGASFNGGTVFTLRPPQGGGTWTLNVLHAFGIIPKDADTPGGIILGKSHHLFGAALDLFGAALGGGKVDNGTVFAVSATGATPAETVLHRFTNTMPGTVPNGTLLQLPSGEIVGTSFGTGGSNDPGLIYRLRP